MVSKNQIKLITSLHQKKYRKEHQLFIAEGIKVIQELLSSNFEVQKIYTTLPNLFNKHSLPLEIISEVELQKMSALITPNECLAVFKIPTLQSIDEKELIVALDDIRDPGNFGTIIRLCDWFGVKQIVCTEQTVDLYNPKVIQATMGSISRVQVNYIDLNEYLQNTTLPIYGTFMDGDIIYNEKLHQNAIIVMGNEANGISSSIEDLIQKRITVPRFGTIQETESLNVATATAIVLNEFRRPN
jgi:TrmH family RNA methyltransferase